MQQTDCKATSVHLCCSVLSISPLKKLFFCTAGFVSDHWREKIEDIQNSHADTKKRLGAATPSTTVFICLEAGHKSKPWKIMSLLLGSAERHLFPLASPVPPPPPSLVVVCLSPSVCLSVFVSGWAWLAYILLISRTPLSCCPTHLPVRPHWSPVTCLKLVFPLHSSPVCCETCLAHRPVWSRPPSPVVSPEPPAPDFL